MIYDTNRSLWCHSVRWDTWCNNRHSLKGETTVEGQNGCRCSSTTIMLFIVPYTFRIYATLSWLLLYSVPRQCISHVPLCITTGSQHSDRTTRFKTRSPASSVKSFCLFCRPGPSYWHSCSRYNRSCLPLNSTNSQRHKEVGSDPSLLSLLLFHHCFPLGATFEFHLLKSLPKSLHHVRYRKVASYSVCYGDVTHVAVGNGTGKGQWIHSVI